MLARTLNQSNWLSFLVRTNRELGNELESTDTEAKVENKLIGNTASAIEAAIKANVDWIEIDIRKSADNELLIFHDSNVTAKTNFDDCSANLNGSSESTGEVSGLTLARLKILTLNVKPKEKILTLDKVFASFPSSKTKWIFDIKADGIDQQVLNSGRSLERIHHLFVF